MTCSTSKVSSAKLKEIYATDDYRRQMDEYAKIAKQLAELNPQDQREAFVWLYLRDNAAKQVVAQ